VLEPAELREAFSRCSMIVTCGYAPKSAREFEPTLPPPAIRMNI
jgi:hypothetical protein